MGFMGVYDIFSVLAAIVGKYWALAPLVPVCVFLVYFNWLVPKGTIFEGDGTNAKAEQVRYSKWRTGIFRGGGNFAKLYDEMLLLCLDQVDRFFGDQRSYGEPRIYLSWQSLDVCLGLALAYPIISLTIIWHITGNAGPIESALGFPLDTDVFERGVSAVSILVNIAAIYWFMSVPWSHRTRLRRLMCCIVLVSAFAFAFVFASAFSVSLVVAVAFIVAVSGIAAFTICLTIIGSGLGIHTALFVVAGGLSVGIRKGLKREAADARFRSKTYSVQWPGLLIFAAIYMLLLLGAVWWMTWQADADAKPKWTMLAFLGALPVINGVFDWLSLGMTRYLLRRGQRQGGLWPLAYALVDLVFAVIMLVAVMAVSLMFLKLMNHLSSSAGGGSVLDIERLISDLRSDPHSSALWWVYVTVFTTFVPSFVNLVLGGLAILRGMPVLSRLVLKHFLPENPAELTIAQRAAASAGLTAQISVALLGAALVGLFAISIVLHWMGYIGVGLVDIANWLA